VLKSAKTTLEGSCEKIRKDEAPDKPRGGKLLINSGSAGASPAQTVPRKV
jgi:hypothetical protein